MLAWHLANAVNRHCDCEFWIFQLKHLQIHSAVVSIVNHCSSANMQRSACARVAKTCHSSIYLLYCGLSWFDWDFHVTTVSLVNMSRTSCTIILEEVMTCLLQNYFTVCICTCKVIVQLPCVFVRSVVCNLFKSVCFDLAWGVHAFLLFL